jgi:hypothetical protein
VGRAEAGELRESPVALPGRIAVVAQGVAGSRVGVYVIDVDGSCLIRPAGDEDAFPRVMAQRRLLATGEQSVRLSTLAGKWGFKPVAYAELTHAVAEVRHDNDTFSGC